MDRRIFNISILYTLINPNFKYDNSLKNVKIKTLNDIKHNLKLILLNKIKNISDSSNLVLDIYPDIFINRVYLAGFFGCIEHENNMLEFDIRCPKKDLFITSGKKYDKDLMLQLTSNIKQYLIESLNLKEE